jgi:hypothetical protein
VVALQLEGLGICHLLEFVDTDNFRENLIRSGHSRRFFLRRSRSEDNSDDRHLALSRTRCFLDAIVAGSLPLARDIAVLSSETWNASWEYEDDFCYYSLLHRIAIQPELFPTPEAEALLARFERSLEGNPSLHFDVCKALLARDLGAFSEALRALLDAEQAKIEKDRNSPAVNERDILFWPKSYVSIEGLALLKIANLLGLRFEDALPLCPLEARLPWSDSPTRDLFAEIEMLG